MAEYLLPVFGAGAVCAVCGFAAYKRTGAERLALSVLLLYAVALPLITLAQGWDGTLRLPDGGGADTSDPEYIKVAEEAFERGLEEHIREKYSLSEGTVTVHCYGFDFSAMRAERITVLLSGKAALSDYKAMERYLESLSLGECEVEIEIR